MKTNYAYIAMKLAGDEANVLHMVLFEDKPNENDLQHMVEELATDESFGMIDMVLGTDYDIYHFEGEKLDKVRGILNIPDEINENT
jgi:hypothetical protein